MHMNGALMDQICGPSAVTFCFIKWTINCPGWLLNRAERPSPSGGIATEHGKNKASKVNSLWTQK